MQPDGAERVCRLAFGIRSYALLSSVSPTCWRPMPFHLVVVTSFAGVAILLAAIGIYAAAAYHVQSHSHEFGLRLALGGGAAGVAAVFVLARRIGDALYLVPGSHNGVLFGRCAR